MLRNRLPTSLLRDNWEHNPRCIPDKFDNETIPDTLNWLKYVNKPRDQGFICSSCAIFAGASVAESAYFIHNHANTGEQFSVQAIQNCLGIDPVTDPMCDRNVNQGSDPDKTLNRMVEYGITLEKDAPYEQHVSIETSAVLP